MPLRILCYLCLALLTLPAQAHKASDGYLYLDSDGDRQWQLRIDLALRDLALILPLDRNGNGQITGAELTASRSDVLGYQARHLALSNPTGDCQLIPARWGLSQRSDGPYVATTYQASCPDAAPPQALRYSMLFEQDALHRGLVQVDLPNQQRLAVLAPDSRLLTLGPQAPSALSSFASFVREGVVHLLIGLDHLLFLLVLVLPATLPNRRGQRPPFRQQWLTLAGVITAFTVAHSITLGLAALGLVTLPIALVETVIALSIAVAAINILWPVLGRKTWKLAFVFGLVHGFGFASVLAELTTTTPHLLLALAGFNVGVELGQLGLLILVYPLLSGLALTPGYRRVMVPAMIAGVSTVSLLWVMERATAI